MSAEAIVAPAPNRLRAIAGRPLSLSFGASAGMQALNVMTGVLLARTLGPHGRGELAAVLLWPSLLAAFGSLGLFDAITFQAARRMSPNSALLGTGLALACVESLVCVAVGVAVMPHVLSHYDAAVVRTAYVFLAFIPLNLITLTLMSLLNGMQKYGQFHALRLIVLGASATAIVVLRAADELSVANVAAAYLVANALTGLVAIVLVARAVDARPTVDLRLGRKMLVFGLQSHSGSMSWMMNERMDQLVISIFLAPARLGLYVTAVTLTSLTSLAGTAVATAAFPVVAKLHDLRARRETVRHYVRVALLVSVAASLPLFVLAPWVIDLFFKDVYSDAANVARVLLIAAVVLSLNRVLGASLKAIGRPLDTGIAEAAALVVTMGGLALLLPLMGIMGAAIVSLAAYSVSTAWLLQRTARALEISAVRLVFGDGRDDARRARRAKPSLSVEPMPQGSEP